MKNKPVSVLIIESHPMMHESLSAAIAAETDLTVMKPSASNTNAFKLRFSEEDDVLFLDQRPDIVLLSMSNQTLNSLRILSNIHKQLCDTPILALTTNEVPGQEFAAIAHGAHTVLTKSTSRDELLHTLRSIKSISQFNHRATNLLEPQIILSKEK